MEDVLKPTHGPRTKDTLRMLLEAAIIDDVATPSELSPASSKENHTSQLNGENVAIRDGEAKQLRAVKKLMEVKGFESMMKFLES